MTTNVRIPGASSDGTPRRALLRQVLDWNRIVAAMVARMFLVATLGMAFWAAAPAAMGWHPTTVMTGSMQPRLRPGDVVVSRPVSRPMLHPGQVLLFDDPDQAGRLRMHRYVRPGRDGMLTTKGDANAAPDSSPVAPDAVHGVGFIRVPYVGLPILWMRTGAWSPVLLVAIAAVAAGLLTGLDRSLRGVRDAGSDEDGSDGDEPDGDDRRGDSGRRGDGRRPPRTRRPRHRSGLVITALVVGGVGLAAPAQAAPFLGATQSPTSGFTAATAVAATAVTCTNNSDNTVTIGWSYGDVTPAAFDVLTGGTVLASTTGTARSVRVTMAQLLSLGSTYPIQVRTDLGPSTTSWTASTPATTTKVTVVALAGLTSVRCA